MTPARLSPLLLAALLSLGACGSIGDVLTGSRSRSPEPSVPAPPANPPATEASICELARQAVREASGVASLRGDSCSATNTRPGEWEARVDFASGGEKQAYRLQLQPNRQRQGWAVMDITPESPQG
jgi:hypothetical protein